MCSPLLQTTVESIQPWRRTRLLIADFLEDHLFPFPLFPPLLLWNGSLSGRTAHGLTDCARVVDELHWRKLSAVRRPTGQCILHFRPFFRRCKKRERSSVERMQTSVARHKRHDFRVCLGSKGWAPPWPRTGGQHTHRSCFFFFCFSFSPTWHSCKMPCPRARMPLRAASGPQP